MDQSASLIRWYSISLSVLLTYLDYLKNQRLSNCLSLKSLTDRAFNIVPMFLSSFYQGVIELLLVFTSSLIKGVHVTSRSTPWSHGAHYMDNYFTSGDCLKCVVVVDWLSSHVGSYEFRNCNC